jgi:hypothetical protein
MCALRTGGEDGNGEWWKWLWGMERRQWSTMRRSGELDECGDAWTGMEVEGTNGRHGDGEMARRWERRCWRLSEDLFFLTLDLP